MGLKLQCEATVSEYTESLAKRSWSNFVDVYSCNDLTRTLLEELHKGLKLGELLHLSEVISLNYRYITKIIVHQERLRPFDHLQ